MERREWIVMAILYVVSLSVILTPYFWQDILR